MRRGGSRVEWITAQPYPRPGAKGSGKRGAVFHATDTLAARHQGTSYHPRRTQPPPSPAGRGLGGGLPPRQRCQDRARLVELRRWSSLNLAKANLGYLPPLAIGMSGNTLTPTLSQGERESSVQTLIATSPRRIAVGRRACVRRSGRIGGPLWPRQVLSNHWITLLHRFSPPVQQR